MKRLYLLAALVAICNISTLQSQTTFIEDTAYVNMLGGGCLGIDSAYVHSTAYSTGYAPGDSIETTIWWGDGTSDTKKFIIQCSGYCYSRISFLHVYNTPGVYTPYLLSIAPDLKRDSLYTLNSVTTDVCGNISGAVYFDDNNNCLKNPGEGVYPSTVLKAINPATSERYYSMTNSTGTYNFNIAGSASYNVDINGIPFLNICPSGGYTGVTPPATAIDMGVHCQSNFDLEAYLYVGVCRPGNPVKIFPRASNLSCVPTSGTMKVIFTYPHLSYTAPTSVPFPYSLPTVSGDTLIWQFTGLTLQQSLTNLLSGKQEAYLNLSTSAQLGDTIDITVIVEPVTGDNYPANNVRTFRRIVNNSYDPNNKIGMPLGMGEDKNIAVGNRLDYTINFQNTGNDVAYKVVLMDTITEDLNIESFNFQQSSHPCKIYLIENRVLKFEFNNINLPDSTSNEPQSHGFVNFSIDQAPSLPLGTRIENRAFIYFDFNDPIETNTEFHTLAEITGVQSLTQKTEGFDMYPNPTGNKVTIESADSRDGAVLIYDITGQEIMKDQMANGKLVLDVSTLKNGLYLIRVNGSNSQRLVITR